MLNFSKSVLLAFLAYHLSNSYTIPSKTEARCITSAALYNFYLMGHFSVGVGYNTPLVQAIGEKCGYG